ncbi:SHD1 domain-containing protein [Planctomycetaceae bacterium SH139]
MLIVAFRRFPALAVVSALLLFSHSDFCAAQEQQAEIRVWRDNTGNFELRARLLQSNATHVQLQTDDGRKIAVPIDRLSADDSTYLEVRSRNHVEEANKYVHDRSPALDAEWEKALADAKRKMSEKRWAKFTKVAVIRARLEHEDLEDEVLLSEEGLCFPSGGGYGFRKKVKSGEFVTVAVDPGNPPRNGRSPVLKVAALKHHSAATKLDFNEGQIVCGGEILLKPVPEESVGQLIVRCIPESGVSISGGSISIAPDDFYHGGEFQVGDDGIVMVDIAPGKYTVTSFPNRDLELQGPALEDVVIRPNNTAEVELKLFRPRIVELEWCCRNPKESLEWQRGISREKSGRTWNESRFWKSYYQLRLSKWDGDNCTIEALNCTSLVRSNEKELPTDDGAPLPSQRARASGRGSFPVVKGAVFECRYGDFEIMFKVKSVKPVED